jgi:hypothetical protein
VREHDRVLGNQLTNLGHRLEELQPIGAALVPRSQELCDVPQR